MSLLNSLKKLQLQARKDKDALKTSLLTVLISDASMIGKNDGNRETTDKEVIKTIKKYITMSEETRGLVSMQAHADEQLRMSYIGKISTEISILKSLLPKEIEGEELNALIAQAITTVNATSMKDMKLVMEELNKLTGGNYNGSSASITIKLKIANRS